MGIVSNDAVGVMPGHDSVSVPHAPSGESQTEYFLGQSRLRALPNGAAAGRRQRGAWSGPSFGTGVRSYER